MEGPHLESQNGSEEKVEKGMEMSPPCRNARKTYMLGQGREFSKMPFRSKRKIKYVRETALPPKPWTSLGAPHKENTVTAEDETGGSAGRGGLPTGQHCPARGWRSIIFYRKIKLKTFLLHASVRKATLKSWTDAPPGPPGRAGLRDPLRRQPGQGESSARSGREARTERTGWECQKSHLHRRRGLRHPPPPPPRGRLSQLGAWSPETAGEGGRGEAAHPRTPSLRRFPSRSPESPGLGGGDRAGTRAPGSRCAGGGAGSLSSCGTGT